MKKFYVEAELEVITLLGADIITASVDGDNDVDAGDSSWGS